MNEDLFQSYSTASRAVGFRGLAVALAAVGMVGLFILPVPSGALDILLAVNIFVALVVLLRGLLVVEQISLASFPTILLLTTLFRLGLNVSSTRLILLNGDQGMDAAGDVIRAFGEFVVRGDFIVGAIIFVIIAMVNFVVITKGSARVAEVAARFSLDSLPGKQISIDADLRSGSITKDEAERRREALTRESGFYGSMDGAMRFIQGDAIATLAIVVINVIGGSIIGLTKGMEVEEALRRFGVLAIGDGLVSILPALLVSVSAGIVVTNVSRKGSNVSRQVAQTLLADNLVLFLAGIAALFIALIPAFPFLPFVLIGALLITLAYGSALGRSKLARRLGGIKFVTTPLLRLPEERPSFELIEGGGFLVYDEPDVNNVVLEIQHNSGISLADVKQLQDLYEEERLRISKKKGLQLIPLKVKLLQSVAPERVNIISYRIMFRERLIKEANILARGRFVRCSPTQILSFAPELRALGQDPILGCPGIWVEPDRRLELSLSRLGVESLPPERFLILECVGAQLRNVDELFGIDELKTLLSKAAEQTPRLVEEFQGGQFLSTVELSSIFRQLIRSRWSIRDTKLILDGILEFTASQPLPDPREVSERIAWIEQCVVQLRKRLRAANFEEIVGSGGELRVFALDEELSDVFRRSVREWEDHFTPPQLPVEVDEALRREVGKLFAPAIERGRLPLVILCDSAIRAAVDEYLRVQRFSLQPAGEQEIGAEWYRTVAPDELSGGVRVETVGVLQSGRLG